MSDSFNECQGVEQKGLALVKEYVASNGWKLVSTHRHQDLQQTSGDFLLLDGGEQERRVELKVERRYTGNAFIELFSNCNPERPTAGWSCKLRSDTLWYVFLDKQELHVFPWEPLFNWLYDKGNAFHYPYKPQSANTQKNRTTGFLVPLKDLHSALGDGAKVVALRHKEAA